MGFREELQRIVCFLNEMDIQNNIHVWQTFKDFRYITKPMTLYSANAELINCKEKYL